MQPHFVRLPIRLFTAALLTGAVSFAYAKLPAKTPEETAKAEATKSKAAADAEIEKQLLAKSQDRVAARYIDAQRAKGVEVKPTVIAAPAGTPPAGSAPAGTAPAANVTQEVPSAALNSRTTEKAGAYNESVTPQSAGSALQPGDTPPAKGVPQNEQVPAEPKTK